MIVNRDQTTSNYLRCLSVFSYTYYTRLYLPMVKINNNIRAMKKAESRPNKSIKFVLSFVNITIN